MYHSISSCLYRKPFYFKFWPFKQWHIATGGQGGQRASLTVKSLPKRGRKSGERENLEKEEKLGRLFHFAPPDR